MKTDQTEMGRFQEILELKEAELDRLLRKRDDIAIERSADQMDEIQYATERDLAIRNVDRDSTLLRGVRTALRRIHDGSFGTCIECELAISPNRMLKKSQPALPVETKARLHVSAYARNRYPAEFDV